MAGGTKHVVLAGLNGDFLRRPIGHLLELVPMADEVVWKRAFCSKCSDGTLACFSHRIQPTQQLIVPGGKDMYCALCRKHYEEAMSEPYITCTFKKTLVGPLAGDLYV